MMTEKPEWVPLGTEEIEEEIVRLAKDGLSSARIGLILRDQFGVPSVKLALDKSILEVMRGNELEPKLPEDLVSLIKKAINLNAHMKVNRKDISNRRNLQLIEAKIRRLAGYYKEASILPADWKYSIKTAEMQIQ